MDTISDLVAQTICFCSLITIPKLKPWLGLESNQTPREESLELWFRWTYLRTNGRPLAKLITSLSRMDPFQPSMCTIEAYIGLDKKTERRKTALSILLTSTSTMLTSRIRWSCVTRLTAHGLLSIKMVIPSICKLQVDDLSQANVSPLNYRGWHSVSLP